MNHQPRHNSRPADPHSRRRWWGACIGWTLIVAVLALQFPLYKSMAMGLLGIDPPDDGIDWRTNFAAAQAEAAEAGRPILVNFTADWCGPCVAMRRESWPRDAVRDAATAGYIPVRLDVDSDPGRRLGYRYHVATLPTSILIAPDGEELTRTTGFISATELSDWLTASQR